MVDITHKSNTLRIATAQAEVVVSSSATIDAIQQDTVPKGNVFAMSKAAGLLGVKKTPELLPDCHPLPIEYTGIDYSIKGLTITIQVQVKTIYKTGVEVEAMHGASLVALNMYDMLKPIDKGVEIHHIKLLSKTGGKSHFKQPAGTEIKAGVLVCSDSVSNGIKKDRSGKLIIERLNERDIPTVDYSVIPDDLLTIRTKVTELAESKNMVIITGGTGVSPRDVTPEAIVPLLSKRLPGVEETIRQYGQNRVPTAMLSRSVVGLIGTCLVIAIPGSSNAVNESMDAILPAVLHVFPILNEQGH